MSILNALPLIIISMLLPIDAIAQEFVTRCVQPSGYKYYLPGLLLGEQSGGWKTDEITGGYVTLHVDAQNKPILHFKDSTGTSNKISAANGDNLLWLPSGSPKIKIVGVLTEEVTEIYMFSLDINYNGTLLLLVAAGNPILPRAGIIAFTCSGDTN